MGRGARNGLIGLALLIVAVGAAGLTGAIRIPYLSPAASTGPEADRANDLAAPDVESGRELAASGGRAKAAKPGDATPDATADPVLPSEVAGTAIGKTGGSMRGRVVEAESKRPVAGATVELLMPEALFHYLRASPVGRFDRLTAMTDREGRFALTTVLPATDYALRVRKGTGPFATKRELSLSAREALDVGDIVLGPSGGLSGRVVGVDGKGIADVRIAIAWKIKNDFDAVMADPDTLPWTEATVKTDAEGAWKAEGLEPGDKTLVAKAPSGAADVKASVTVVAGNVTSGVDWALGGALPIAGRVEWADGKPIEGARVFAKTMNRPASFTVESAADGTFRLVGMSEGVYFVGAFIPGMSVQLVPGKKAGDENVRVVVPLAGALAGRVISKATGHPIRQFRLTPVFADAQDWMQKYVGQKIDKVLGGAGFQSPEGTFRLDRLKAGHYTIHVEAEGFPPVDSAPVEVVAGAEARSGDIALADGNRVSGVVRDAAGAPIADASVFVLIEELPDDAMNVQWGGSGDIAEWLRERGEDARSDERGAFRTEPMTPRAYQLGARRKGYVLRAPVRVDVTAKSVEGIDVRLDVAGSASLEAIDPRGRAVRSARIVVCDAAGDVVHVQTNAAGVVALGDHLPGRFAAIASNGELRKILNGYYRQDQATRDGPALYERLRAMSGAAEFAIEVGVERSLRVKVPSHARVEGRVGFGGSKPIGTYFLVASDDYDYTEWVEFDADGRFTIDSIETGHYLVLKPATAGDVDRSFRVATTLDVPESDVKGVELDLSK